MLDKLKRYLDSTSPDQIKNDWEEVKTLGLKGPSVNLFVRDSLGRFTSNVKLYKDHGTHTELIGIFTLPDAKKYTLKWGGTFIFEK